MDRVFVVTSGEYSDYGIEAIYTDRALAEAYIKGRKEEYSPPEIEEWRLDVGAEFLNMGYHSYRVRMDRDGNSPEFGRGVVLNCPETNDSISLDTDNYFWPQEALFHVWAKSPEHAVKIANEHRVQMIANGEWR